MRPGGSRTGPASLRWLALVGIVSLVVAACQSSATPGQSVAAPSEAAPTVAPSEAATTVAPSGEPTRAETLIVKAFRKPDALIGNQYIASSDALISDGIHQLVNEPLFYFNYKTGGVVPWVAEGYSYNADNTEITIQLRDGVKWQDGVPFTADDVVFTLEQIGAAKAPYRAGNIQASVASATAVDPHTVKITLKAPNPRFVQTDLSAYIYTANFTPVPKHIFEGQDFATFPFSDLGKGWPFGTGPYKLSSIGDDRSVLVRDDNWWAAASGFAQLPAPRQVIFSLQGPEDTIISELASNQVDWAGHYGLTPTGAQTAMSQNAKIQSTSAFDACPWSLTVNAKAAPWDDPQMRWVLNASIDKNAFSSLFNTPFDPTPARSTFPEFAGMTALLDANADLFTKYNTLEHSLDKAAQILTAKGYKQQGGKWTKDGKPLTLRLSIFDAATLGAVWTTVEQLLVQNLTDAGFTVESKPGDFGVVLDARTKGTFDIQSWFECGSVADPWATLNRYAGAAGTDNPGGWNDATYNDLVAQIGKLAPGDPQVDPLFRKAFEIWLRDLPVIPLAQRPEPILTNTTYWTNWPTDDNGYEIPQAWIMSFHNIVLKLKPAGS
jgi:peptide/nickel transport system substrate-binding protein